jgi:GT2 family glycosyltransferase
MRILCVIVIYNRNIEESQSINSLLESYSANKEPFEAFKLIIYDNSLEKHEILNTIPFEYEYVYKGNNDGVAKAYNYALNFSGEGFFDWLLLLDQDSSLPIDFVLNLVELVTKIESNKNIVAIVPKVFYRNKLISPSKILWGGIHRPIDEKYTGISTFPVTTIGSGVLLRMPFLKEIGGFNEVYWLDWLDHWLFYTINTLGKKIYITDSVIEHELSILIYENAMSEWRYKNILKFEKIFMMSFNSKSENYFYLLRLLKRSITLFIAVRNKKYSKLTFQHFINNCFFKQEL